MTHFRKYKTSKGEVRFRAEIRIKGAKSFSKSFMRLTDAKIWAKEHAEDTQRLSAGIVQTRYYTIGEAIERYRVEHLPNIRSLAVSYVLDWWEKEIGDRYLHAIRPAELVTLRYKLLTQPMMGRNSFGGHNIVPLHNPDGSPKTRKPKTVQNYLDVLLNLYNKAIMEWEWVEKNPVQKVKKLKANNERTRFLSDHYHLWPDEDAPKHWDDLSDYEKIEAEVKFPRAYELPRLIEALKSQQNIPKLQYNHPLWTYYLFVIQLGCGLRLSEATHMVWEENSLITHPIVIADLTRESLILKSTKQDASARSKPICPEAMEVLKILYKEKRADSPLVFPGVNGQNPLKFDRRIVRAIKEAGLQDFRWHDIRHTTASYLSMMGAGQKEIMDALHHKSLKASQRYQHLSSDHLRGLLSRLTKTVLDEKQSPSRFERVSGT